MRSIYTPSVRSLKGLEGGTITILGAGTGFGVSCLARFGDRVVPMATEGGHMGFAPSNAEELAALQLMWKQSGRVSIERILSGERPRAPVSNAGAVGGPRAVPAHGR